MSYCRWSECDVYAYDSCEGGVRFWVAGNDSLNRLCSTYNEAYQYAKELRDKHGLDVPLHAIDELREDAIDEAKQYFGPDSAVADMMAENAKLKQELEAVGTAAYLYGRNDLADENAKLQEQMERLVTLLRNDCDIDASWDGLRHFWSIELTEDGCLMRDRACKAEVENAKLRELVKAMTPFLCCMPFASCNTLAASVRKRMSELGIEVGE